MSERLPILAAIDTAALIWGVRQKGEPDKLERGQWLFRELEDINARIIVPSVVVAEYLVPVDSERRKSVVASLSERFIIHSFDVHCAVIAAELHGLGDAQRPKGTEDRRKCLKADCMIIATAFAHKADRFYSHDKDCRNFAETLSGWEVRDLPPHAPTLF